MKAEGAQDLFLILFLAIFVVFIGLLPVGLILLAKSNPSECDYLEWKDYLGLSLFYGILTGIIFVVRHSNLLSLSLIILEMNGIELKIRHICDLLFLSMLGISILLLAIPIWLKRFKERSKLSKYTS